MRRELGDVYGGEIVAELRAVRNELAALARGEMVDAGVVAQARGRLDLAIAFLRARLSEAALAGCHHCDEEGNGRGAPCHWCGLVYSRRRV